MRDAAFFDRARFCSPNVNVGEMNDPAPLTLPDAQGRVEHDGARIWYASYGSGSPVVLLHGGLGSGDDWGNQVPALIDHGRRVILIDSRGQGRSTRDARPLSYDLLASDVLAVMDALEIERAAMVGWSDGAIVSLTLAMKHPSRVERAFAFAGNMDLSGVKPVSLDDPAIARMFERAAKEYARLSETPDAFGSLSTAVGHLMETQPNYTAGELATISVRVAIAGSENDEFIKPEHLDYLVRTIPGAKPIQLRGVGHFAPFQDPERFNDAMLAFLDEP